MEPLRLTLHNPFSISEESGSIEIYVTANQVTMMTTVKNIQHCRWYVRRRVHVGVGLCCCGWSSLLASEFNAGWKGFVICCSAFGRWKWQGIYHIYQKLCFVICAARFRRLFDTRSTNVRRALRSFWAVWQIGLMANSWHATSVNISDSAVVSLKVQITDE